MNRVIGIIVLSQIFYCCHSSKSLVVDKILTPINLEELVQKVVEDQDFKYYNAKGKISYSDADFSGEADISLKLIKDSLALITIKKFGIELFRILIDQDSVTALDRIQHTWQKSSILKWVSSFSLPLDFAMLQDIITSGFYLTEYLNYSLTKEKNAFQLTGDSELFNMQINFSNAPLVSSEVKIMQATKVAYVHLNKHLLIDKKYLPTEILIKYLEDTQSPDKTVNIVWKEIKLNEFELIKFEIPKNYSAL